MCNFKARIGSSRLEGQGVHAVYAIIARSHAHSEARESLLQSLLVMTVFNVHKILPIVLHKAAEVSKIGHYRRGELLRCMDGRANPLMDRKVVGAVFFGMVAMVAAVTSPTRM